VCLGGLSVSFQWFPGCPSAGFLADLFPLFFGRWHPPTNSIHGIVFSTNIKQTTGGGKQIDQSSGIGYQSSMHTKTEACKIEMAAMAGFPRVWYNQANNIGKHFNCIMSCKTFCFSESCMVNFICDGCGHNTNTLNHEIYNVIVHVHVFFWFV